MSHENGSRHRLYQLRRHLLKPRRVGDHLIGDARQLLNERGNTRIGIQEVALTRHRPRFTIQ